MGQAALVYRARTDGGAPAYVGKAEFQEPLVVKKTNAYLQNGQWHFVRVDRIEPATWSPHGDVVPTVYVSSAGSRPARARIDPRAVPRRGQMGTREE
jgi:hypothetical protein